MPNWVKNVVYVKGNCGDFWERIEKLNKQEYPRFFNEFVPRPECYEFDTTNYTTNPDNHKNLLEVGDTIGFGFDEKIVVDEKYLAEFKEAEKEQKKHGSIGWYDWDCDNWGTKWDASAFEANSRTGILEFETAWCYPEQFFEKLSKMYPEIRFYVIFADEDLGVNCGCVIWNNGTSKDIDTDILFAETVWAGENGFENFVESNEYN